MADWIRRISVRVHWHIVIAARVRVLDGSAWWLWRWPVRTVKTTYVRNAWFATADVLDVIVGSYDELNERATCPIVLAKYIRQFYSSATLSLVVPICLRAISVPPPYEGVTTLHDALHGRHCSSNASSYAATQSEV